MSSGLLQSGRLSVYYFSIHHATTLFRQTSGFISLSIFTLFFEKVF